MQPRLTIGMAVFDDYQGAFFTLQALRLYHQEAMAQVELVVVDNNPSSNEGKMTKSLMGWLKGDVVAARYVPFTEVIGTAAPRNRVFQEAQGEAVLCLDPHVLIPAGTISRLLRWYAASPKTMDLFSGPLLLDDLQKRATHFDDAWRAEMHGIWGLDPRGEPTSPKYQEQPFETPAQGLGLFTCRKEAWLGFNPNFKGFGGEEFYIHEKYRQAGRKHWCLPWLTWVHRFGRPAGVKYPLQRWDKARNYVIGRTELGLSLDPVHAMFVGDNKLNEAQWTELTAQPTNPPPVSAIVVPGCDTCGKKVEQPQALRAPSGDAQTVIAAAPATPGGCTKGNIPPAQPLPVEIGDSTTLDDVYAAVASHKNDIAPHASMLRNLAAQCQHVTEISWRRELSTVALLAGRPKLLVSYGIEVPTTKALTRLAGRDALKSYVVDDPCQLAVEDTDMLFLSTRKTAEQLWAMLDKYARKVKRWLVLHGTQHFGARGEDGKPGLMPIVRKFVATFKNWTVTHNSTDVPGLLVLSCDDRDKKQPPGLLRKALNFSKALAAHAKAGMQLVDDATYEARMDQCLMCEHRFFDVCAKCGCPVASKCSWGSSICPDTPPRWLALPVVDKPTA